jgi:hypothetical protein
MKHTKLKIKIVALAALMAVLIRVQTVQADSNTLANLVGTGGTLTIDDKTFSNFGYSSTADASELDAEAVNLIVSAYSSGGVDYLDWSGLILVNNSHGSSDLLGDLKLTYTVTANPGSINLIDQQYTPNAIPAFGQIIIGETVYNGTAIVGNSTLTLNPTDLSDPAPEPGDNLTINPSENQLSVVKDITIDAFAGDLVGLSDVEQSFHQTTTPVPEPASAGLFLSGLVALACFNRLRKNIGKT